MKLFPKFRVATPFCESETTKKNTIKQQIATNTKQKRVNYLFPITRRSRKEKNGQILTMFKMTNQLFDVSFDSSPAYIEAIVSSPGIV